MLAKNWLSPYQFFRRSAQREIIPSAKNNIASIQLLLRKASIKAIPKNKIKTVKFVNFIAFIFIISFIIDLQMLLNSVIDFFSLFFLVQYFNCFIK